MEAETLEKLIQLATQESAWWEIDAELPFVYIPYASLAWDCGTPERAFLVGNACRAIVALAEQLKKVEEINQWQRTRKVEPSLGQVVEAWDTNLYVARRIERWDCREDEGDCDHADCDLEDVWQFYIGGNHDEPSNWMDWTNDGENDFPPFWRELVLPPRVELTE